MHGEINLKKLLSDMSPELMDGEFVFCSYKNAHYGEHTNLQAIAVVKEREGLTFLIPKEKADEYAVKYVSVFKGITLKVPISH